MRASTLITMLVAPLALALAACDREEEATDMPMAAEDMPMDAEDMPMTQGRDAERKASAEGTVTAIDAGAGTISIEHGPIAAVEWPAMTMAFEASETLRQQVAVGDEVEFAFRVTEGGGELTSISKK